MRRPPVVAAVRRRGAAHDAVTTTGRRLWNYDLDFGVYYFRIPLLGLLGFPPFAWESWAMFQLLKRALRGDVLWRG